jgi:hypothetical protein
MALAEPRGLVLRVAPKTLRVAPKLWTCPEDCCGDGICDAVEEDYATRCPEDC